MKLMTTAPAGYVLIEAGCDRIGGHQLDVLRRAGTGRARG
jgi:hypothetical protein